MGSRREHRRSGERRTILAVVSIAAPGPLSKVVTCLEAIGQSYKVCDGGRGTTEWPGQKVVVTDSATLVRTGGPLGPAVVVCSGAQVPDVVLAEVEEAGGSLLCASKLSPVSLFTHLFHAGRKIAGRGIEAHLGSLLPTNPCTAPIVSMFADDPARTIRTRDLQLRLGIGAQATIQLLRELGLSRAEHLSTFLRAETWIWSIQHGLDRRVVERFLGIRDRSNFRRACQRARIDAPWHPKSA